MIWFYQKTHDLGSSLNTCLLFYKCCFVHVVELREACQIQYIWFIYWLVFIADFIHHNKRMQVCSRIKEINIYPRFHNVKIYGMMLFWILCFPNVIDILKQNEQ